MRTKIWTLSLAALGLAGGIVLPVTAQTGGAGSGPYQARGTFTVDGAVQQVDADRDRVTFTGDDGHAYTLDTYKADISLRDTQRSGQTGDLVAGMRLHVTGIRLSNDVIEVDQVVVLPYHEVKPVTPPRRDPPPSTSAADPPVTLRGTVQSIDQRQGTFILQVNDHTRKVYTDGQTDLRDLDENSDQRIPLHTGDRVSVVGVLADDGTVQATLVTPRRLDAISPAPAARQVPVERDGRDAEPGFGVDAQHQRTLVGRVSKESDYFSRDIKVRLSASREITVQVPKSIPIRREGRAISVHDLKDDQVIRVTGDYVNDGFKATRIERLDDAAGDHLDF